MKKVAIVQSNYIPWKGYFDMISQVDEFVLYDDMQYTKRDWRNRNKIKTTNGLQWLSVPVDVKGKYEQKICETKVSDQKWAQSHLKSIHHAYSKSAYYNQHKDFLKELYERASEESYLSKINYLFISAINKTLGINTEISWSMDYDAKGERSERLLDICKKSKADLYLSGPAAKTYLDEGLFLKNGVNIEWMDYSFYPIYNQLYPPFEHGVSVLDLIFNRGDDALQFICAKTKK